jgi:hypothetical protein
MSEISFDEELANKFIDKIIALAVKAEAGASVAADVLNVIDQAEREFVADKEGSERGNLMWMMGQLKFMLDSTRNQPWARTVFDYALNLVRERLQRHESSREGLK